MEKKITFLSLFLLSAIAFAVVTTQDASAQQINSNKEGCATCPPAKLIPNGQYALVEQTGSVYRFAITDIQESFYYKMIDAPEVFGYYQAKHPELKALYRKGQEVFIEVEATRQEWAEAKLQQVMHLIPKTK